MRILIVPDKFKGTLTAGEAARSIARGWRKGRPGDRIELLPMSDGGDGFGEVIGALLGARRQTVRTMDAARRPCRAPWWWAPRNRVAVIESARVIGLAMLPPGKQHPFDLDTFGLGAVLRAAAKRGAKECLLGIGGSATNDAGFGMARALGWSFLDRRGAAIERWTGLREVRRLRAPGERCWSQALRVAVDVGNPLSGPRGATRVYGPQKGLRPEDFALAEACLGTLAKVAAAELGRDFSRIPGSGAAGGLGFGLLAFLGATFEPGFEVFARLSGLEARIAGADVVVTGEGAIDRSSLMGKGAGQVAARCRALGVPCLGLAGMVVLPGKTAPFSRTMALTDLASPEDARGRAAFFLEKLAREATAFVGTRT